MSDHGLVFVDTAYVLALVNTRDEWHAQAMQWQDVLRHQQRRLLTSEFVLLEIADGLSSVRFRGHAVRVIDTLTASDHIQVVPATTDLYKTGFDLFRSRPDKEWGLTDCTSFVIMRQHGVQEALTCDAHFQQAGFRALLVDEP